MTLEDVESNLPATVIDGLGGNRKERGEAGNPLIHVLTIANDSKQYQAMRASFARAGFDGLTCRYSIAHNGGANTHEPYSTLNALLDRCVEPYVVFCHQDVLLTSGSTLSRLLDLLAELNRVDPRWAVCGNAGGTASLELAIRITDPHGTFATHKFPVRVQSLDENFLVVKTASRVRCSSNLYGFHFYGTDLCLNALHTGYSAYVIDFHLHHLSGGRISKDFLDSAARFEAHWNQFFWCRFVQTTCYTFFLSRLSPLRELVNETQVSEWFRSHARWLAVATDCADWLLSFIRRVGKRPQAAHGYQSLRSSAT